VPRYLKHILFWIVILFFQVTRSLPSGLNYSFSDTWVVALEHIGMLPILAGASYFTADWIFPRYFYTKKWMPFVFMMVLSSVFFILLMRSFLYFIYLPKYFPDYSANHPGFLDFNLFQHTFYIYSTVAIVLMIKYLKYAGRLEKQRINLEKQNYASELALLRSQVNPHFLFNTLNNISALIRKDPDRSYKSVIKLSDIMRYMLFEAGSELVPLKHELDYLNSYLGLLSLRHGNPDFISFTINGDPDDTMIAPMLLIPFVENAYKHGDKNSASPGINITLTVDKETVDYKVINYTRQKTESTDPTSGIGIPNLKRRLELIYPGNHNITTDDNGGIYTARLFIKCGKTNNETFVHHSR
jgi:two-component system LytT family sensor kinase